ncbi:ribokinase [Roseomonas hellenica]|uniref:Ribokinase n=1 Tax=Plastoroseomonas hellenica TaxID=2687306 RepID=A0ABS5F8J4_9PROT|nr:ribokinase [Plastoroseomonas hellenica]MBR0668894.1 ribokinase [Plastoroseomonas hellenica]
MTLVVVGSYNRDRVLRVPHLPAPGETLTAHGADAFHGGKGSNQAVQAARCGGDVVMVAALGRDAAGEAALALWAEEGIRAAAEYVDAETGQAVILVDDAGENSIVVLAGANAVLSPARPVHAVQNAMPRAVLAQRETPEAATEAAFAAARALGAITILNAAPAGGVPGAALLALTDLLVANEGEAGILAGGGTATEIATGLGARHRLGAIITLGAAGAVHAGPDGALSALPSPRVVVRDTTGAGDAFVGCLAAAVAAGRTPAGAMTEALAAGALACTVAGAVPSLHRGEAIRALAARHSTL